MTDLFAVVDGTWPAATRIHAGGFCIRQGQGGGSRVSSASLVVPLDQADLDTAIAAHRAMGQQPRFMIRPEDTALDAALEARGYELYDPVVVYQAEIGDLPDTAPPMAAIPHWPPLAIAQDIWAQGDIGPARLAIMHRAAGAKTAMLGRVDDRAAGVAFVALHQDTAMLHALYVPPDFRRLGLAQAIMAASVNWAAAQGAKRFALVVTRANEGARALYERIGLHPVSRYHYRREVAQ
ncbi:MAG TPA: GNAT family N-acetyltransferase [Paenirhodobacter sp.]